MKPIPHLSKAGWRDDSASKLDLALSHFLVVEPHQTELFKGEVNSLQNLVAKYGHDRRLFETEVKNALEKYIGRYFDGVEVETQTQFLNQTEQAGPYEILIYISALLNGVRTNISSTLNIINSKFKEIARENNGVER